MLDKPESCRGCPFAGDMKGFVPDKINDQAEVTIVMQNPGEDEEHGQRLVEYKYGQPMYESVPPEPAIGKTGFAMRREYFPVAGLTDDNVSVLNILKCRAGHKNKLPPLDNVELRCAITHCMNAHFKLPEKTNLIIAQGEIGLYGMTQEGLEKGHGISNWRGWVLPHNPLTMPGKWTVNDVWTPSHNQPIPVLAVNHLAYIFRFPTASIYAKVDWSKIPRILKGSWPRKPSPILEMPPVVLPRRFAFDTEFDPHTDYFLRYSMAYPSLPTGEMKVHVVEREDALNSMFPTVMSPPLVIAHHIMADIEHLEEFVGLGKDYTYDDTMHQHAVLWAGLDHDLDTLGSLYSPFNRWKHLEASNPRVYSGGDAEGTYYVWDRMVKEFRADPDSKRVYDTIQIRLVRHIRKSHQIGIKVLQVPSVKIAKDLQEKVDELQTEAEATAGWPINLSSNDMTAQQLFDSERLLEFALPKPRKK